MANSPKKSGGLKRLVKLGIIGLAIYVFFKPTRTGRSQMERSPFSRLFTKIYSNINKTTPWHKLPYWPAVGNLIALRTVLRDENLRDTRIVARFEEHELDGLTGRKLNARTADGTFNDLEVPTMGAVGTRFSRNVPLDIVYPNEDTMLTPNPRTISRDLLTRNEFIPATILNMLAGSWLQFMVHDWFSHGNNDPERVVEVPLAEDDPWPAKPMTIRRTLEDDTRSGPGPAGLPPTFTNEVTHWWDASQIYGSSEDFLKKIRTGVDGKLIVDENKLLPLDPETGLDITGVSGNYWLGLSILHTLFSNEHNSICDMFKSQYPNWSDDEIFDHARLVNCALLAKIHTVEWTPGILPNPVTQFAMRGNWWGLLGEDFYRQYGRIGNGDFLSGILGSETDHHAGLYAMTEEFVAVYRMHALIPDDYSFRSANDDSVLQEHTFPGINDRNARVRIDEIGMSDIIYSFGTSHPGAVTLHNFPRFLQQLEKPSGRLVDLASIDILRDRERGVPRYNQFREMFHMPRVNSFEELTDNPVWAEEIREVYNNDIDSVDLMVGLYSEPLPEGFGFSDTAFRVFALMASRRLKSDRFFTSDYTPGVYTPAGMQWVDDNTMSSVLLRHFPELSKFISKDFNAFAPWPKAGA